MELQVLLESYDEEKDIITRKGNAKASATRRTKAWQRIADRAMSRDQCESVASSVESMLEDAQRVQTQCRTRSDQLALSATQLRVESAALRQQAETVQLDMAWVRRQLDQLMDTKAAFDASERTARKLSKHL
ncbi:unnamed protein product [Boreogadus saida]